MNGETPAVEALHPFGAIITLPDGTGFDSIPADDIHAWVERYRVVVLRGVVSLERVGLPLAARRLGPLQVWSFGSVHELKVKPATENYLYTDRAVPLHWDGAFVGEPPRYLVFHCVEAPSGGGETEFVDTARAWQSLGVETQDRFRALRFRYSTEKKAYYGGSFESPLVAQHEVNGGVVLRFAEPVDDLNPVTVDTVGLDPLESARIIREVRDTIRDERFTLRHAWREGDVVVADNLGLLHGRRAFDRNDRRLIRRVNVRTQKERSIRDELRDAVRIRRPEFMVAEVPILLIPALLSGAPFRFATWAPLFVLFFLLFHVGDMVNCLADRDLDLVYKPRLAEAVRGLGPRHVALQIAFSCVAALGIAVELLLRSGRWEPLALTGSGLLLGLQYSLRPLYLKGRGLWQIPTLWALIFVGPMMLVWTYLGRELSVLPLALFGLYGLMQQGIVLLNTAEDIPEDRALGIRTSALALGLTPALSTAIAMSAVGGLGTAALLGSMLAETGLPVVTTLLPLVVALSLVLSGSLQARRRVVAAIGEGEERAVTILRTKSRNVPIWITLTALASLFVIVVLRR